MNQLTPTLALVLLMAPCLHSGREGNGESGGFHRGDTAGRQFVDAAASLPGRSSQPTDAVDYDIFESLRPPALPDSSKPGRPYDAADLNFRLKPGSHAIDAGVRLPNVNDGFAGKAPDLGAYEVGQPAPICGPRWLKEQPFHR